MIRRRVLIASVLMMALLVLGGCTQPSEPAAPADATTPAGGAAPASLSGTSWNCYEFAVSSSPQTVPEGTPITAEFSADGKLTGNASVNSYSTTYKTEGDSITIEKDIVTTKMAGSEEAMAQETDYLTTLPTAVRYNIVENGDLVLFGPADNMIARYHPAK